MQHRWLHSDPESALSPWPSCLGKIDKIWCRVGGWRRWTASAGANTLANWRRGGGRSGPRPAVSPFFSGGERSAGGLCSLYGRVLQTAPRRLWRDGR
eukprot:453630-Rhodomonas_salina.4